MVIDSDITKHVYDCFAMYFPSIAEKTLMFKHIGLLEYAVLCEGLSGEDSRCVFIYDDLDKTLRHRPYLSSSELTSEEWAKEFGYKLKRAIHLAGYTQEEVANELGASRATINRYVNGRLVPTYVTIRDLAKLLRCEVDTLANF